MVTLVNAGQHCWKACWGQPLASSNLASSATSDQAMRKPRSCVRPGSARLRSLICSLIHSTHIGIKCPKGAGARFWILSRLQAGEAKDIDALISLLDPDATVSPTAAASPARRSADRGPRADRARLRRSRRPGTRPHGPRAHGQRPARPDHSARPRHRGSVGLRPGRPADQAHLGSTQPRETPALDDGLTRVSIPSGPPGAAAIQPAPSLPCSPGGPGHYAPPASGGQLAVGAPARRITG